MKGSAYDVILSCNPIPWGNESNYPYLQIFVKLGIQPQRQFTVHLFLLPVPIKKAECRRTDAFELWCWRRLLRVPWTARRSNQSILKEISPGCSLERLMLKLKLQYFGHLMRRADSLEKTLMLGKIEGRKKRGRGWDGWMASPTQRTWVWVDSGSWLWTGRPGVLQFMGLQRVRHDSATELNWTECQVKITTLTHTHTYFDESSISCPTCATHFLKESESKVAQWFLTLFNPVDWSRQAPPSMGFSRQEHWSRVPLPSPQALLILTLIKSPS